MRRAAAQDVEESLGHALVRAFRTVNRAHNRALKDLGLSAEQAHILILLWVQGPMNVGSLQRQLMLSSATLTGAIDRMERAGLVRRVVDPGDRRAFLVEPGPVPAAKRRKIEASLLGTEEECFGALGKAERANLRAMLQKIAETLAARET
jgi:DNA-binding MarR family transcriptional regulator